MSRFTSFPAAIVLTAACALAFAGPPPAEAAKMTFRVFPPETKVPPLEYNITPFRINDMLLVIVKETVRCGQKAINASFAIKDNEVSLRYELTPAAPNAAACASVSEFKIENVPHGDVSIGAFSGGPEPASLAEMQKCPKYNPKSDDVWVCLMPTKDHKVK